MLLLTVLGMAITWYIYGFGTTPLSYIIIFFIYVAFLVGNLFTYVIAIKAKSSLDAEKNKFFITMLKTWMISNAAYVIYALFNYFFGNEAQIKIPVLQGGTFMIILSSINQIKLFFLYSKSKALLETQECKLINILITIRHQIPEERYQKYPRTRI